MPTKTTSNKPKNKRSNLQKARTKAPAPKKISTSKYIFIGFAVLVVLGGLVWWFFGGRVAMETQKSMESYLEDKYKKNFSVGKLRLTGAGLAVTGSYRAQAHPIDDPTLEFEVGKHEDQEKFFDGYTGAIWAREEKPKVEALLRSLYGEAMPEFKLKTHIATDAAPDPIRGTVPGIDKAISQYRDQFYYDLSFYLTVQTLDGKTKEDIKEKFITLAEFVRSRGAGYSYLAIPISVIDENTGYLCKVARDQFIDVENIVTKCLESPSRQGVY